MIRQAATFPGPPSAHAADEPAAAAGDLDPAALAAAPDAIVALNADLHITSWNRAAESLYGIPACDAVGGRFPDLVTCHPGSPAAANGHRRGPDTVGLVNGPATHVLRSGRPICVRVTLLAFGPAGRAGGNGAGRSYLAVIRDDSQQLQLASSLQARLALETLLAELSVRFANLGEDEIDSEIEKWLGSLAHMLDVDRSSFAELTQSGLVVNHSYSRPGVEPCPLRQADQALPWLTRQFQAGRMVVLSNIPDDLPDDAIEERAFVAADGMKAGLGIPISIGGSVVCVLMFSAFRQPRAWPREVVSRVRLAGDVFANAIARRQAKQRLQQKQHELAHVGRVAAMGELASVIAHELDQPLTAVVSNAEAVRNLHQSAEPDLAEADDALRDIIDAAMRMSEIVRRERRLLRRSPGTIEQVDLNEAIREVELFIRAEARQYGVRVVLDLLPGAPAVPGDRVQLQQVALNLARNGLQAMREQPPGARQLTIRTACDADEVVLTVIDAGPPADEAVLERMFEPFYTTKANGLGMGLSISRSILDAHRGRLWATRNADTGLTMHVAIPRK